MPIPPMRCRTCGDQAVTGASICYFCSNLLEEQYRRGLAERLSFDIAPPPAAMMYDKKTRCPLCGMAALELQGYSVTKCRACGHLEAVT